MPAIFVVAFAAGIGDYRVVTTLCHSGNERMRRSGRFDSKPLLTRTFPLNEIKEGYCVFGEKVENVLKVAIRP